MVYYVVEGKGKLSLTTPDRNNHPGWWVQAMPCAYAHYAAPPDARALVLICQCPVYVHRGTQATAPPR